MRRIKIDTTYNKHGFTLIELLAVLAILGILATIDIPSYLMYIEKTEKDVCYVNRAELERLYETHLSINSVDHTDATFGQYLKDYGEEICPEHGEVSYVNGEVECCVHSSDGDSLEQDNGNGSVPFL